MKQVTVCLLLFSQMLFSQNLIKNPSFEITKKCVHYIGRFNNNVSYWTTPSLGTTDLFNTCAKGNTGIPDNYNGKQFAKDGKNYAGIYVHSENNYREYIQSELVQPLKIGEIYTLSFYVCLAEKSDFAIKSFGVLLSENKITTTLSREISNKQLKKYNLKNYSFFTSKENQFLDQKNNWKLVSITFKAIENDRFLTLGNFFKNSKTNKILVSNKNRYSNSYYYIDMVSLVKTNSTEKQLIAKTETVKKLSTSEHEKQIEINKNYTFNTLKFKNNSADLSEASKHEIKNIYRFLKQNLLTKIIISGYTDNVGSKEYNLQLSKKRANSVKEYFLKLGLDNDRIIASGFGYLKPISSYRIEEGKSKNRRVEFMIIENN